MPRHTFQQAADLSRWEGLRQGRRLVGGEVVPAQHDVLGLRGLRGDHLAAPRGDVHRRAPLRALHPSLPRQRLEDHAPSGRALALVLVIATPRRLAATRGWRVSARPPCGRWGA
jgi:hypothetical protein